VYWGAGISDGDTTSDDESIYTVGDRTTVYSALDEQSGAAVAFTDDIELTTATSNDDGSVDGVVYSTTLALPSTESTDAQTVDVRLFESTDATNGGTDASFTLDVGGTNSTELAADGATAANSTIDFTVGQVVYTADLSHDGSTANVVEVNLGLDLDQSEDAVDADGHATDPQMLVVQPEDENDNEHAYVQSVTWDGSNDETNVDEPTYSGSSWSGFTQLESDTDVSVAYDYWGTYVWHDSDDQGAATYHLPNGQAVAGAGFTDEGGALSGGGGGGSVTYDAIAGMGALPDMARLDTEVTESVRSNNHLILVGGPAVNTLVSTLEDNGDVDFQDLIDAQSGAVLQVVDDAFASGQHAMVVAGYAADDTRSAARYIANYADHESALADADSRLVLTEADYPSSQ
jgi:hypothetical protein